MGEWIMALFGDSIALLTFFSIFAAGMVFTVFQLLLGGDADGGDVDGDLDGDVDGHVPGLLSVRGVSLLMTGFGGVAFIAMYFTEKVFVSTLIGLLGGFPFALACIAMYRVLVRQEASSMVSSDDFVGATGTIVTSIPDGGLGEVTLLVKGQQTTKSASTADGSGLKSGTAVKVTAYHGDRVTVQPFTG